MTDRTIHEGNFMGTDVRHKTEAEEELEKRLERIEDAIAELAIGCYHMIGEQGVKDIMAILRGDKNEND